MTFDENKQDKVKDKTYIETGDYLLHEKQFEDALKLSESVLNTDKYNPDALYIRACARYLKSVSDTEPEEYFNDKKILGITAYDLAKTDLSEAMSLKREIYKKAKLNIEISPLFLSVFQYKSYKQSFTSRDQEKARNMFYDIYLGKVKPQDPLKALDEILHLYRDFDMALVRKGEIHYGLKNYEIAIRFFKKALFSDNYHKAEVWDNIAKAQLKQRDINSARKTLKAIKAMVKTDIPGKHTLTLAALRSLEGDFYNAQKNWKKALYFRSDAILLEEELLPLKRFEIITIINRIMMKKRVLNEGIV